MPIKNACTKKRQRKWCSVYRKYIEEAIQMNFN